MALVSTVKRFSVLADTLQPLAMLLLRGGIGLLFAVDGWNKLHHLDGVTAYFTQLKIPAPHAQAIMVSLVQFIGGLCLVLGLAARLAALPLAGTMAVAILTAKLPKLGLDMVDEGVTPTFVDKFKSFVSMDEFIFLCVFIAIFAFGPGKLSLDHVLGKRVEK